MTFVPSHVDEIPPGDAWQEIEAALDELSRLARSDVEPVEFHRGLLQRLVGVLGSAGGAVWHQGSSGLAVECQINLGQSLANDKDELARHRRLAEQVADGGQPRIIPAAYRDAEVANASPWLAILCPIVVENNAVAIVEVFQRPEDRSAVVEGHLRLVRTTCEIAEEYHKSRKLRELNRQQGEIAGLVDYVQRIHRSLELPATAAAIANEARRLIGCDRVSVLDCLRRQPRVVAISGVESFDRKSGVVQTVERLARLLRHASEPLWMPNDSANEPTQVQDAIQALLDETHAASTGLVPLMVEEHDEGQPIGAFIVETFNVPVNSEQQKRAAILARASGPALANAIQYDRIPLRGPLQRIASLIGLAPGQRWSPALAVTGVLAAAVVALWLIPADLAIEARGQLMPQRRQHVFAPSDGIVMDLPRRDGDSVRQDELLARLHSPMLDIEESELIGKLRTVQEELIAAETATLRSETENTREPRTALTARVLTLKEELRGLESQLGIVRKQQAELAVKSPLGGTVITWDLERQLAGRPVKRGELLLTVADTDGPWELLLDVADYRAGHVIAARKLREDLQVSFQLGTNPGRVGQGKLASVSSATELSDEAQPTLRAAVNLENAQATQYRPGASVVARIHCGRRSLGYVWLHEAWEAIRLRLFI